MELLTRDLPMTRTSHTRDADMEAGAGGIVPGGYSAGSTMASSSRIEWRDIYHRLRDDPNEASALRALVQRVSLWASHQLSAPAELRSLREDVVQETCAAVVIGLESAYGEDTFAGFVYGHFLNARRRAIRLTSRGVSIPLDDIDVAAPISPSEPTEEELRLLQRCLLSLPPRERRAIELRYFGDASAAEIALKLGVSECNARQIVFKGLSRLRKLGAELCPQGRD